MSKMSSHTIGTRHLWLFSHRKNERITLGTLGFSYSHCHSERDAVLVRHSSHFWMVSERLKKSSSSIQPGRPIPSDLNGLLLTFFVPPLVCKPYDLIILGALIRLEPAGSVACKHYPGNQLNGHVLHNCYCFELSEMQKMGSSVYNFSLDMHSFIVFLKIKPNTWLVFQRQKNFTQTKSCNHVKHKNESISMRVVVLKFTSKRRIISALHLFDKFTIIFMSLIYCVDSLEHIIFFCFLFSEQNLVKNCVTTAGKLEMTTLSSEIYNRIETKHKYHKYARKKMMWEETISLYFTSTTHCYIYLMFVSSFILVGSCYSVTLSLMFPGRCWTWSATYWCHIRTPGKCCADK